MLLDVDQCTTECNMCLIYLKPFINKNAKILKKAFQLKVFIFIVLKVCLQNSKNILMQSRTLLIYNNKRASMLKIKHAKLLDDDKHGCYGCISNTEE